MKICCLGDSLTEGDYGVFGKKGIANVQKESYPFFLKKLSGAEVKNFGKCGYTATTYLEYYNSGAVDLTGTDIVLILLGTNGGLDPVDHTPGNDDYLELIRCCQKDAPLASIILCTPPHVTENPQMSNCGYASQVRNAVLFVRNAARRLKLPLIDLAACGLFTAENEAVMQPNDGLHFGAEGYRTMAEFIFLFLKSHRFLED